MLVIITAIFISGCTGSASSTGQSISSTPKCENVQVPYTEQEEYTKTESYTESVPYTDTECTNINMIYKIENIPTTNDCMQYDCARYDSICVEQGCARKGIFGNCEQYECVKYTQKCAENKCIKFTEHCGIKIINQERESAAFNIEFNKYSYDTKSSLNIETNTVYVDALDSRSYYWDFMFLPTESVTCYYRLTNQPQRQECKDVIKYRDVQKEKQVTAYRPVTKYKTEQKCN